MVLTETATFLFPLFTIPAQLAVGLFFAISGWHKAWNPERRASLRETLEFDRYPGACVSLLCTVLPLVEFVGGGFVAIGLLTRPWLIVLGAVCLGATLTDGWRRIPAMHPIDPADAVDDFLYLPEVWLGLTILALLLIGPSPLSLDWAMAG